MMKIIVFIMLSIAVLGAKVITIASYNVENLFDLKTSGYEYSEYVPNSASHWNLKNYNIKLKHIAKVIQDMNPDIIGLQEIESRQAFKDLKHKLTRDGLYYKYSAFAYKKDTTVKVGLLSKYPIISTKELVVNYSYRYRNILQVKIKIDNQILYLFVNHWKSKSGKENERIKSARVLYKEIKKVGFDHYIIALGDFNSNYNEYQTISKRNNNTHGKTGVNNILKTIYTQTNAQKAAHILCNTCLYNLWYDTIPDKRYSYIYKHKYDSIDNIIVNKKLLTSKVFHYKIRSMQNFQRTYLFNGEYINRWQLSRQRPHMHLGKGYSDHLPVEAKFIIN